MRRTRPKPCAYAMRGVTLIELVLAIVLIGIIIGATVYFLYPVSQSVDLAGRAELTDIADNALQRIGREVRLALPNSVRRTTGGSSRFLEFLPVRTGGRYRSDSGGLASGTDCPDTGVGTPASDQLSFNVVAETCFKTIGTLTQATSITTNDFVVFNNYGELFDGQNAYAPAATLNLNRRKVSAAVDEGTRERITFIATATALDRALHDSPGKRFFVVIGNAATGLPEAVTYECNLAAGTLTRHSGYTYTITGSQPIAFGGATSVLIANDVSGCEFDYVQNVAPQVGLLTLRLTLSKALSGGAAQAVTLYHAVHITNVP